MILDQVLLGARRSTRSIRSLLASAAEAYPSEPDLAFTGRVLSARLEELLDSLEAVAADRAVLPREDPMIETRFEGSQGAGSLSELRDAAVLVRGGEIDWMILRQGSLAVRDRRLAELSSIGIDEMRRVARWLNTRINEATPQIVMSG